MGLHRLRKNSCCHAVLKWHDFSRASNCRKINAGFSPGGMLFATFSPNPGFFRSLFTPKVCSFRAFLPNSSTLSASLA